MPTEDQLARNARVARRKVRELEGKLAAAGMVRRQAIEDAAEAKGKPNPDEPCVINWQTLDRFSFAAYDERFLGTRNWRPTVSESLRRVRMAAHRTSVS